MKYLVDIDGILCKNGSYTEYATATPLNDNIQKINSLYEAGHKIIIYTSRLSIDSEVTKAWLGKNGVKYHETIFDKPTADFYIDDKAIPFIKPDFVKEGNDGTTKS